MEALWVIFWKLIDYCAKGDRLDITNEALRFTKAATGPFSFVDLGASRIQSIKNKSIFRFEYREPILLRVMKGWLSAPRGSWMERELAFHHDAWLFQWYVKFCYLLGGSQTLYSSDWRLVLQERVFRSQLEPKRRISTYFHPRAWGFPVLRGSGWSRVVSIEFKLTFGSALWYQLRLMAIYPFAPLNNASVASCRSRTAQEGQWHSRSAGSPNPFSIGSKSKTPRASTSDERRTRANSTLSVSVASSSTFRRSYVFPVG